MDVGWGTALEARSEGQDIVGVRGLDQSLEASLVVGITTISLRGRYLTLLPWAIGEYFAADAAAGVDTYDEDRFRDFIFRMEFLALACTAADSAPGAAGGALGSVLYSEEMGALRSGSSIAFPRHGRGPFLGTYFGPCRALGLVRSGDEARPYVLTPRGRNVWEARNQAIDREAVTGQLTNADILTHEAAVALAPHFSLKGMVPESAEAAALREALLVAWTPESAAEADKVETAYARFEGTLTWLRSEAADGLNAEQLLTRNWRRVAYGDNENEPTRIAWAEFEWRRRLHFSLELLLSAVSQTLRDIGQGTPEELVELWLSEPDLAPALSDIWPEASAAHKGSGREAADSVPEALFLEAGPLDALSDIAGAQGRAMAGFALVATLSRQSAALRSDGRFTNYQRAGERALAVVDEAGGEPFPQTLLRLTEVAARAHLEATFGKMERGQKCSLRFFPEGQRLRTTGGISSAGRSGPRLRNVIQILRDAGVEGLGAPA